MWSMIFAILLIIAAVIVWDRYFKDTYLAEHDIRPDHYVIPADSPMVSLELRRPGGASAPIAKKSRAAAVSANEQKSEPKPASARVVEKAKSQPATVKAEPRKAETKKVEVKKDEPEKTPAKKSAPQKRAAKKSAAGVDDLTQIKGIGKVTAQKLTENGVTTFAQIAALTDEGFDRLNEKIRFRGKVDRAAWAAQAKELMEA